MVGGEPVRLLPEADSLRCRGSGRTAGSQREWTDRGYPILSVPQGRPNQGGLGFRSLRPLQGSGLMPDEGAKSWLLCPRLRSVVLLRV